ncbi:MAG: hypothetical protein ACXWGT_19040 [Usitatibacter sp.]
MKQANPPLFYNNAEAADVETLLTKFPIGSFASPYRSTVPLVCLIKDAFPIFRAIEAACGGDAESSLHFEYEVAPPGVEGNPSQTDLMVLSEKRAIAIEAKWTEPRYPTVSARLKSRVAELVKRDLTKGTRDHQAEQEAVMAAWLGLLTAVSEEPAKLSEYGAAVYQTVHRAASACSLSRPASLVYLHFEPSPVKGSASADQYRGDLRHLHRLLGSPDGFPFYLVGVPLTATSAFGAIAGLQRGAVETDRHVRKAIMTSRLFEFGEPHIERIGAEAEVSLVAAL